MTNDGCGSDRPGVDRSWRHSNRCGASNPAGGGAGVRLARRSEGLVGMIVSWQEGKRRVGCEPIDQPVRLATSREQVRAIDEWRRKEPDGFVTVTGVGSRGGMADRVSCRCDSVGPLRSCLGSEDPQGRSGDQVALKVESVGGPRRACSGNVGRIWPI